MPVKADKQWRRVLTSRVNRLINFHNYILLVASLAAAVSVVVDAVFPNAAAFDCAPTDTHNCCLLLFRYIAEQVKMQVQ